jgi:hypothetical protein
MGNLILVSLAFNLIYISILLIILGIIFNNQGRKGLILMAKFLNNEEGEYLKFILDTK